jgi:hypothetical protein
MSTRPSYKRRELFAGQSGIFHHAYRWPCPTTNNTLKINWMAPIDGGTVGATQQGLAEGVRPIKSYVLDA